MTRLSKVKQNTHQHKDKSCNLKKHKKSNSRPNRAVWTVFVNCAHWRGSTLAIYETVQIIFPLNLQTITITLDVVKWRWGAWFFKTNLLSVSWLVSRLTSPQLHWPWLGLSANCPVSFIHYKHRSRVSKTVKLHYYQYSGRTELLLLWS